MKNRCMREDITDISENKNEVQLSAFDVQQNMRLLDVPSADIFF